MSEKESEETRTEGVSDTKGPGKNGKNKRHTQDKLTRVNTGTEAIRVKTLRLVSVWD